MDEVKDEYTAWRGQNGGNPSSDARQMRFPGEFGSLPVAGEIVNDARHSPKCPKVRHIIPPREPAFEAESASGAATACSRHVTHDCGRGSPDICSRPCHISHSHFDQTEALRLGYSEPLLRRSTKKWQDPVHLRSSPARDLRKRIIPALRIATLLVPQSVPGAAHRHIVLEGRNKAVYALLQLE